MSTNDADTGDASNAPNEIDATVDRVAEVLKHRKDARARVGQKAGANADSGNGGDEDDGPDQLEELVAALAEELNADTASLVEALREFSEDDDATALEREANLSSDPGQKTSAADDVKDALVRELEQKAAETLDEQQRDDLGRLTVPSWQAQDGLTDDHGRRNRRRGMTPSERRRKLEDELGDVEVIGQKADSDDAAGSGDGDESGDVDPRISDLADGEGW